MEDDSAGRVTEPVMRRHIVEQAKMAGATDAEQAAKTREMTDFAEMYNNPLVNVAMTFLAPLPVGLAFTPMTAGVLGRKRRPDAPTSA